MVLIVTATCRIESCQENGVQNVFEREAGTDGSVFCGKCGTEITDIVITEKHD